MGLATIARNQRSQAFYTKNILTILINKYLLIQVLSLKCIIFYNQEFASFNIFHKYHIANILTIPVQNISFSGKTNPHNPFLFFKCDSPVELIKHYTIKQTAQELHQNLSLIYSFQNPPVNGQIQTQQLCELWVIIAQHGSKICTPILVGVNRADTCSISVQVTVYYSSHRWQFGNEIHGIFISVLDVSQT